MIFMKLFLGSKVDLSDGLTNQCRSENGISAPFQVVFNRNKISSS
jgi:hypothetical protein